MKYLVTGKPYGVTSEADLFMDRMMKSCFRDAPEWESRMPSVDIKEEEGRYLLEAELPGYSEKDVCLKIEENLLILEANHGTEKDEEASAYLMRERSAVSYKRSFVLPKNVDASHISASMKNGVLSLELQKNEAVKPRTIEIKVK